MNTRIVSNLCNALQFVMRRRIFNPAWMLRSVEQAEGCHSACPGGQIFGLAASMAALVTAWPISLACSASERI